MQIKFQARIPCSSGAGGVGSIPANSDAQNVPSFRRWRFEMKLSPFCFSDGCFSTSPPLSIDFGQSKIEISITALGENNPRYSDGDSILATFSGDTNSANLALDINETQVDFFSSILSKSWIRLSRQMDLTQ
jgi:hypothetical protein